MDTKLKPCPFCGGEAEYLEGWQREDGSWVRGAVKCCECSVIKCGEGNHKPGFLSPEEETELSLTAIEAWNTRAERTCRNFGGEEGTNGEDYDFACGSCGFMYDGLTNPNYCPHCSAKVVE